MHELATSLGTVLIFLAACFAGPAVALSFLIIRKRHAQKRKRSPLTSDLLRSPGQSLREDLIEAESDLTWDLNQLVAFPTAYLAIFFAQVYLRGQMLPAAIIGLYLVVAIGISGYLIWKLTRSAARIDRLRLGYDGELAVGQELDQLMREGAFVFHDVPADKFNIDHVVVSTSGLFAIETKGYSKPNIPGTEATTVIFDGTTLSFPTWRGSKPLEQAERQAAWLSKWLTAALASPVVATPVLALPGWYVKRAGQGPVRVYSGKELRGLLRSRRVAPLSEEAVLRAANRLEDRCKTVRSQYAKNQLGAAGPA